MHENENPSGSEREVARMPGCKDWFEIYLEKYPDLPSVVLIRSIELKHFPVEFLKDPVLDLCCGDGFFAECLSLKGVYGCDIDEAAVDRAADRGETYAGVCKCDARDLKMFADEEFNTVFSNCALEHVDGIDRALASTSRVLKTGGHLVMSVPGENLNRWFFLRIVCDKIGLPDHGRRLCEEYNRKQQHINIHSFEIWRKKLENSGLTIEKSFYLFRKNEYKLVTFFESFVIDSFPGNFFRKVYSIFRKTPVGARKFLWRTLLKRVYLNSRQIESGGELFIVARKTRN